ncbi:MULTISPECIES: DUF2752 domain-containing protein [unclassified Parafrankia]|uniref:DUF2752 domain-containing protein n=1 Tax=unclassified Parafrankia TaxID=2994368 RepID=UPI000DA5BEDA|nr:MULTISPECIES: DUF2752 domain-containing protein [unclassified Parafrankia]TCJ34266.1 DUF2752 domain-containing protein [Parafrankia sp. BMG5.11]SQD99345.1 conserved hypothetical protein [Parafrankia sp. Ea1.12]
MGALAVGVCVRVYLVDPAEPGHYPSCPFRALTTWDCPGCGTLRGLHQLLHGHPTAAADHNLFFVLAAPGLALGWLIAMARCAGWRRRVPSLPPRLLPLLPALIAVFWAVRNLPGPVGSWLASSA